MSTQQTNKLRSTNVYGTFGNFDTSSGSILANGQFQRNLFVGGDLTLGLETLDASNNAIDTGGNIKFTLNKIPYSIPLRILSYIQNVSSDIQAQINNISSNGGNISSVGYITQTLPDTNSTQFGNNAYNKTSTGIFNTAIGSSNLYQNSTGNYNTSVGYNSMANNTTGGSNCSVGYTSLSKNTRGSCNTAIGLGALTENISGNHNSSIGQYSLSKNTSGSGNTAFGSDALSNNTTGVNNVSIGKTSGLSMIATNNSTCIGNNSDCAYSKSTALGYNSVCTDNNQIMLGTSAETVVVPNDINFGGSINGVSRTVFSYLSSASSNLQEQINTLKIPIVDISWISGTINRTNIRNACSTEILTFTTSLNNISVNTFSFLSGLTGNIQNQINSISNTTPVGTVIQFAGNASSLPGYLPCNGNQYSASSYPNLFNVIGDMYGGDSNQGWFKVPNY
jgi:hypothetical protein